MARAARPLLLLLAGALPAVPGCAVHREGFDWVLYQDGVARLGASGEEADPAEEARLLGEELERCDREGLALPPGVRAHLGWLHLKTGNGVGARQMFEAEKAAFPESTVFMDRLLERMAP